MELGNMIKKYRLEKNITQDEMACALFVTPQAVSRWENALSLPDTAMLPRIVKYLGVSADILLGCNEPEQKTPSEQKDEDVLCQDQINSIFGFYEEKKEPPIPEKNKTVVITDDSAFMRMLLCDTLTKAGYRTLTAESGTACLSLLENEKADICTMDIGMPEMNGLEVLAEIKRKHFEIKVVMLSAQSTKENVLKARELGAEHFISKPFSCNTLLKIFDLLER